MTEPRFDLPVSAFIICKDERDFIGTCIRSLDVCRDIVVVDSGSTDGTLDILGGLIAEGFPIRLFERAWPGYARQKQFALEQTREPWCLSLDADECLDARLRAAIRALPLATTAKNGYWLRRRDYLPGYGYPPAIVHASYLLRLVRRNRAAFDPGQSVHEAIACPEPTEELAAGLLLHHRDMSVAEDAAAMNGYSTLKARQKAASGRRGRALRVALLPALEFLKVYVGQRYLVCGLPGLIYAAMKAQYVFLTEAKIYRLSSGKDVRPE